MKAEKCACPLTAEAGRLQRSVNGYAASLQDNWYIVMQNSSVAAVRVLICADWR